MALAEYEAGWTNDGQVWLRMDGVGSQDGTPLNAVFTCSPKEALGLSRILKAAAEECLDKQRGKIISLHG